RGSAAVAPPPGRAEALVLSLDALAPRRLDETAQQLSRLWAWFRDEFGGPSEFLSQPGPAQDEYLDKLNEVVGRSEHLKGTDLGCYYYSSAMLREYLL